MKIGHLKIRNYRCFESLDLDLERCHALVGENGCGKTTVLEAINMATSAGQPYLNEQDFNNKDLGDLSVEVIFDSPFLTRIPDGYATQDIPCKSILLKAHRREKAAAGKALSDPFVVERYYVPIEYNSGNVPHIRLVDKVVNIPDSLTKTPSGYESPRKKGTSFKFTTNRLAIQNETINLPNVFYFDRDREDQSKVGYNSLLQKVARDLNWRYRKSWNQSNIETKWTDFYDAVISTVEDPKNERIIRPIRNKLKNTAAVEFDDLEFGLLDIEQPFSKTFIARRNKTNQIEQKRFGSGLSILVAYYLLDTISKLSKEKIIYLIDEPELHLHPQLQYSLFKEFHSSKYQTIYATQSDNFLSIAEWKSVSRFQPNISVAPLNVDLERKLEGKKLSEHLDDIKKWHQHQSIFFKEDNQIFFAKKCLLVEGPAEKYGLPVIARLLDADICNVTIISCNGKSKIPYYQLLCTSFRIPFFTLFDLDGTANDQCDNRRPFEWAKSDARAVLSTSFEDLLGINDKSGHKASELLTMIDSIGTTAIPSEITDAVRAIARWAAL